MMIHFFYLFFWNNHWWTFTHSGGFKPVDIGRVARPLVATFMSLFQRTFNLNTNLKFIHAIQQAVTSKKYGKLERGFKKAVAMSQQVRSLEQQQQEKEEEEEEEEVGEEVGEELEEEVGKEGEGAATRKRKRPPWNYWF